METSDEWFYEIDGIENGPVTSESIRKLIDADMLNDESRLWKKTWPDWKQLNQTEFKLSRTTPPPLKNKKKKPFWKRPVFFVILAFSIYAVYTRDPSTDTSAVRQSYWDNSVDVAEDYLKKHLLKDPSSYESVDWTKVVKNSDNTFKVTHTFRARNGFGGMGSKTLTFYISSDGKTIIDVVE